ncbi:MAG: hypothetical protein HYV63_30995 [Candidatus Schekmanbacteria bacterium]|nr:hypothetical protein [Candidatus Schekmanbacteria bacterium]
MLADELPIEEPNLPIILCFASDRRVKDLARTVLAGRLNRYVTPLYMYRRSVLQQVARELGIDMSRMMIDIKGAIEEIGIRRVVEEIGIARVVIAPFIEAFGIDRTKEALRHLEAGQSSAGNAEPRKRRKKSTPAGTGRWAGESEKPVDKVCRRR